MPNREGAEALDAIKTSSRDRHSNHSTGRHYSKPHDIGTRWTPKRVVVDEDIDETQPMDMVLGSDVE